MLLKLRFYGDPVLRKKSEEINKIDDEIIQIAKDLIETMHEEQGIGLAAPQVGISKRIVAIDAGKNRGKAITLINPLVTESSGKEIMEEGCLSFPEIYGNIERPYNITIKALNIEGKKIELKFEELEARAILHEIDHLDGVLFIDRMSPSHKMIIKNKLNKLQKETKKNLK